MDVDTSYCQLHHVNLFSTGTNGRELAARGDAPVHLHVTCTPTPRLEILSVQSFSRWANISQWTPRWFRRRRGARRLPMRDSFQRPSGLIVWRHAARGRLTRRPESNRFSRLGWLLGGRGNAAGFSASLQLKISQSTRIFTMIQICVVPTNQGLIF